MTLQEDAHLFLVPNGDTFDLVPVCEGGNILPNFLRKPWATHLNGHGVDVWLVHDYAVERFFRDELELRNEEYPTREAAVERLLQLAREA